jgi:hypothetical protein
VTAYETQSPQDSASAFSQAVPVVAGDTAAPTVTISKPAEGESLDDRTPPTFRVHASEPATIECMLVEPNKTDGSWFECGGAPTATDVEMTFEHPLAPGTWTFRAKATDAAANVSEVVSRVFQVKPTEPAPAPAPPQTSSVPALTGPAVADPRVGGKMSGAVGSWTGTQPITYDYEWLSCAGAAANDCQPREHGEAPNGAVPDYALRADDRGRRIRLQVLARNSVAPDGVRRLSEPSGVVLFAGEVGSGTSPVVQADGVPFSEAEREATMACLLPVPACGSRYKKVGQRNHYLPLGTAAGRARSAGRRGGVDIDVIFRPGTAADLQRGIPDREARIEWLHDTESERFVIAQDPAPGATLRSSKVGRQVVVLTYFSRAADEQELHGFCTANVLRFSDEDLASQFGLNGPQRMTLEDAVAQLKRSGCRKPPMLRFRRQPGVDQPVVVGASIVGEKAARQIQLTVGVPAKDPDLVMVLSDPPLIGGNESALSFDDKYSLTATGERDTVFRIQVAEKATGYWVPSVQVELFLNGVKQGDTLRTNAQGYVDVRRRIKRAGVLSIYAHYDDRSGALASVGYREITVSDRIKEGKRFSLTMPSGRMVVRAKNGVWSTANVAVANALRFRPANLGIGRVSRPRVARFDSIPVVAPFSVNGQLSLVSTFDNGLRLGRDSNVLVSVGSGVANVPVGQMMQFDERAFGALRSTAASFTLVHNQLPRPEEEIRFSIDALAAAGLTDLASRLKSRLELPAQPLVGYNDLTLGGKVISTGGGNVISTGGGNVISTGGGNLTNRTVTVTDSTGRLISDKGLGLIGNSGSTLIGNSGNTLISDKGLGIIATDGASFRVPTA